MNYILLNICQQLLNLTSVLTKLFVKCFSTIFKNTAHAFYKKTSMQSGRKCLLRRKRPTKTKPRFYESGIPVSWDNLFSNKQIWFFNRILLEDEISLNRGPHFARIIILQVDFKIQHWSSNLWTQRIYTFHSVFLSFKFDP